MCFIHLIKTDTQCHVIRTANNTQLHSHIINVSLFYMNESTVPPYTVHFSMNGTYNTFSNTFYLQRDYWQMFITNYIWKFSEMPACHSGWSWLPDISFCQLTRTLSLHHINSSLPFRSVFCVRFKIRDDNWMVRVCVRVRVNLLSLCWVRVTKWTVNFAFIKLANKIGVKCITLRVKFGVSDGKSAKWIKVR